MTQQEREDSRPSLVRTGLTNFTDALTLRIFEQRYGKGANTKLMNVAEEVGIPNEEQQLLRTLLDNDPLP